jgi:amphi-Trp domain-containing protein
VDEFNDEEQVSRELAAERLADLAYALTAGGTLQLRSARANVSVPVASEVLLKRTSTAEGDRVEVLVELSWSA